MKSLQKSIKHKFLKLLVTGLTLPMMTAGLQAAESELGVEEIISKANKVSYYAGDDGRSDARMMIVDKDGNRQLRQFVILRKDIQDEGDQNFLVVFSRPSDVRGTVFLVNKHVDRDDDRWLYLPGLDLEKRISAGDKRTSFVGSDFFYEDVSGRNPALDSHELLEVTDTAYIVKNVPQDKSNVEFAYYIANINKETFLPMTVEYFNDKGEVYRRMDVAEVEEVQGIPTVMKSKISNLETGSVTYMEFRRPVYNIGVPEDVFTSRSLRNPPREWLEAEQE
ncbi:outer membrane lipoprotein-sorting protein [Kangiella aquimarina]|uniref:Outer membrane lipoprotein-sorting protein n=1 Tax=Kangiella aquimarina TaxID=261965 RepID=A0ABZ0X5I2_9GAMM|nr:outer membrane lipoprotein-sorting protein [Kangiella aquimarina]WQG85614.1 outer membrane lipoprotein-sorting protein [Kangiella aquimarina]